MGEELEALEIRKSELTQALASDPPTPVRLHPNLAEVYRAKVEQLREALNREDSRAEAAAIFRDLIDEIRLMPVDGDLGINLIGDLAASLDLCAKKHPGSVGAGVQITLVAGARNQLNRLLSVFEIPLEFQWYSAPLAHLIHRPFC